MYTIKIQNFPAYSIGKQAYGAAFRIIKKKKKNELHKVTRHIDQYEEVFVEHVAPYQILHLLIHLIS